MGHEANKTLFVVCHLTGCIVENNVQMFEEYEEI